MNAGHRLWKATLLSAACIGAGHWYLGRAGRGLLFLFSLAPVLVVGLICSPYGSLILGALWSLFAVIDARRLARP